MVILWVALLPFWIIIWWAMVLAAIDYAVYIGRQEQENDMQTFTNSKGETVERARLIRYGSIARPEFPDLLSQYDEEKNLIVIDARNAAGLPQRVIERLEMTTLPATRASDNSVGFEAY